MAKRRYRLPDAPACVVTGGGSGIGRAICLELAALGGTTVVVDIRPEAAQETLDLIVDQGGQGIVFECDVTDPEAVRALSEFACTALGRIDLVVNNAGVITAGVVGEVPLSDWRHVMDVNLWGVIHGCHYFVPILREQGRGLVINVASITGLISAPELAPYSVSKAGVVSLSSTLAAELSQTDVGVTVLAPSMVKTGLLQEMRASDVSLQAMGERLMVNTGVTPATIAKAVLAAAQRGQLYVVPQFDAKFLWSLQRLLPTFERWLTKRLYGSRWLERQRQVERDAQAGEDSP